MKDQHPPAASVIADPRGTLDRASVVLALVLVIAVNWLANALVYNGLSFYSANLNVNSFLGFFISSAVEIPSYFVGWFAMDKWGRRWVLFTTMTSGGVAGICCMFVPMGERVCAFYARLRD